MNKSSTKEYINISKEEYVKLKTLEKRFSAFWNYIAHLKDIEEARRDIKSRRVTSQEKLFRKMGL